MTVNQKFPSFLQIAFLILLSSKLTSSALPPVIKIAALFDETHGKSQELAFHRAVKMVNDDRTILTRSLVSPDIGNYPWDDSFKASKKLCELIMPGVAAIFGPTSPTASNHVQSVSDALHLPFLETRWDYDFQRSPFSINVHPHPSMLGKAYADFVHIVDWKSFVILYESEEGLVRLQELIKLPKTFSDIRVTLRQLPHGTTDYRPLLKEIKKSEETKIVLDCSFDNLERILSQANELHLLTDYHSYLVTSLDVDKINLSPYTNQNVNISGFSLTASGTRAIESYLKEFPNTGRGKEHMLFSENALVYDAVWTFAKALNDLDSLQSIQLEPLSCEQPGPWADGEKVLSYLKEVDHLGLTGEIKFDADGYRTDFQLELMEKMRSRTKKTGIWTAQGGVNYTLTATEIEGQMVEKLQNKTLKITTALTEPFVIERIFDYPVSPEAKERMSFEERFEGFCVDLIKELSKEVKFKYKFQLEPSGSYGSFKNGKWTGMIAELRSQQADMAAIDMSITSIRQRAVDFTMPFMNTGVGILYKKKKPPAPNLFSFLSPLSLDVWIYMTTAYLGVSILMFLLARISPYEWNESGERELSNNFNISNALWFGIGSFLCQGCDILPKAISTRMVAGMWWFFTLIMISSYTANLAAFLTAAKMDSPINSAEDLAKQTKIKYGTYCCGSTNAFFQGSTIPTYQKINAYMESTKPSVYTTGNSQGLDRVLKEDGMYAFFMEAAAIEYHVERKCDLKQLGGLLDSKGYGIALPKDSPYTAAMSAGVLRLQESGKLQELKIKWWKNERGGGSCSGDAAGNSAQLDLASLGGVFIVLIGGMVVSIIIAIFEFTWKQRKLAVDENESVWAEMWEELKFAVNFRAGDTKPIKRESSRAASKSLLSKSKAESLNKYGVIGDEAKSIKSRGSRKDSNYACFNDNY
ncbi:glutamate receptor ionotropic, kainate 2 isoform X2 [Eurytemora carolleeae]|uniref:glutamate receptor ionotropic, kainate 2 isoform X2 n=1 Tax=Eurytemora carolleeae TaxID=1294199 RepID=UPI000C762FC0|nr:glutamate receptor ionotropic, kainate 2 isoform X2 [Eurytemora carolleeae]|eukprot:XP_023349086.1 glutamate receptor ionotropic, kainate 2-like isoform X2 [Eurytemora affinis]